MQHKEKRFIRFEGPRVEGSQVELRLGRGSAKSGGGFGGFFWHIFSDDQRAGRAWINYYETDDGEARPSITVMLNQKSRGRGIGTIAFRRAAEMSSYDEVYATVARKNIASCTALERAGFAPVEEQKSAELHLVWRRNDI